MVHFFYAVCVHQPAANGQPPRKGSGGTESCQRLGCIGTLRSQGEGGNCNEASRVSSEAVRLWRGHEEAVGIQNPFSSQMKISNKMSSKSPASQGRMKCRKAFEKLLYTAPWWHLVTVATVPQSSGVLPPTHPFFFSLKNTDRHSASS